MANSTLTLAEALDAIRAAGFDAEEDGLGAIDWRMYPRSRGAVLFSAWPADRPDARNSLFTFEMSSDGKIQRSSLDRAIAGGVETVKNPPHGG